MPSHLSLQASQSAAVCPQLPVTVLITNHTLTHSSTQQMQEAQTYEPDKVLCRAWIQILHSPVHSLQGLTIGVAGSMMPDGVCDMEAELMAETEPPPAAHIAMMNISIRLCTPWWQTHCEPRKTLSKTFYLHLQHLAIARHWCAYCYASHIWLNVQLCNAYAGS